MELTKELSIVCCQACINAYKGTYGKVVPDLLTNVKDFSKDEIAWQTGNYGKLTLLIFCGTEGWQDILDNIKYWKTEMLANWFGEKVNAYTGITEQYTKVRNIILELIQKPEEIIVTGHSLGGALATICSGDFKNNFPGKNISCVTFGSPRIGGNAFAKRFNELMPDSLRYVYGSDTVTKFPPIYIHYKHVSTKVQLGKLSKWEKIFSPIRKITGNPKDHDPERYLKELKK
jgi:triacylglycerol lipase